jgi:DNA-directed RNA polymerase subunit RPC12/RpoP
MVTNESLSNEPFWIDEPNPYSRSIPDTNAKGSASWWISRIFQIYAIFVLLFIFVIVIFLAIKFPLLWILVAFEVFLIAGRFFLPRFKETRQAKALRIQQLAKDKTGAACLGSAIHTAGHPLLQVNQPVVLALKDSELAIYGYASSTPIDTFSVNELQAINPVVFDDDHIPHVGVIDNTAQALQLSFQRQNINCTCSFRRMYKVRPIEWFHAIQKARLAQKAG